MSGENRTNRRKSLKYLARIHPGDGKPPCECELADISETGARVMLKEPTELPERFTLLIGSLGAAPRHCRVVWREGAELGLEFKKDLRPVQAPVLRPRRDR